MAITVGLVLRIGACSKASVDPGIDVFAASSVADVVEAIGRRYSEATGVLVHVTRGASGVLCSQIENGARCDVYIPAQATFIQRLGERSKLPIDARRVVARNQLSLIVRTAFASATVAEREQPASERLIAILRESNRIAIGNADHAPAGRYALEALDGLGIREEVTSKLVLGDNVRLVAQYVAQSAADCGFVYTTDALAFADRIGGAIAVPADLHEAIEYEACAVGDRSAGRRFVDYLASDAAKATWTAFGFQAAVHP